MVRTTLCSWCPPSFQDFSSVVKWDATGGLRGKIFSLKNHEKRINNREQGVINSFFSVVIFLFYLLSLPFLFFSLDSPHQNFLTIFSNFDLNYS
jgi:formate-dependent nitrite reductase membrane component NrfD